jgi:cytochrome c2
MGHDSLDGGPRLPQDPGADYGKILLLDRSGGRELYSLGHRNPEGITVARDGSVWSTEHGPRGGDELNRVLAGGNYGWPYATYGTEEDQTPVSTAEHERDHGPYQEPVYAWVPSVGISSVIELGGEQFPTWTGDLLVASLNGRSLFRLRMQGGRVVYSVPIPVGYRVRDLVEDRDGEVILYLDRGELITIADAGIDSAEATFAIWCGSCHRANPDRGASAPGLEGVWGRRAGSVPGYDYSEALLGLDLEWDEATLERFLADPPAFAPGTTMRLERLPEEDRRAVIEFLRTYR